MYPRKQQDIEGLQPQGLGVMGKKKDCQCRECKKGNHEITESVVYQPFKLPESMFVKQYFINKITNYEI